MGEIVNKVAKSGIITLDLSEFLPEGEVVGYDIKENLWQGIALKEKDFRAFVKEYDWSAFQGKHVALFCSEDAIIPTWAYMLLTVALEPFAESISFGSLTSLKAHLIIERLRTSIDPEEYKDTRVVVKGCGDEEIPEAAFVEVTRLLKPHVKTIMYGEPCSTVPVYKKPREKR